MQTIKIWPYIIARIGEIASGYLRMCAGVTSRTSTRLPETRQTLVQYSRVSLRCGMLILSRADDRDYLGGLNGVLR